MRFEVDLTQEEGGIFKATAVAFPDVTATGRTEKEALGLLMEALGRYMKQQAQRGTEAPQR
jgi:predicted RNase H-like HicB family nuclease